MPEKYPVFLGVKLSKAENNALLKIAKREGLNKSLYVRQALRSQLIAQGVLTVYNPAPEVDTDTAQAKHE